ncbi:MAG: winged helix-turn-helix transcriptional regulator [Burkholderiales bacterium]|nr:winged helix-turn-helix transcriptional regulator [Burkholderiales bacterium]MDE2160960.1 winged helix-turn-helix transcriptional regulator [Burkholderiales bacterium]MDE2504401.1 winged helix-turn-helix transcriptional regulator [Burkholderiales bacterium]
MNSSRTTSKPASDPLQALDIDAALPVERFVTFRVNQLSTAFERQWSRVMRERAGVSLSQWRILAMLEAGPAVFARLVDGIGIDKALMSRSTRELEAQGLVRITATPADARSLTLALTPEGRRLLSRMMPLALRRQRYLLSALTSSERSVFYRAVEKLRTAADRWEIDEPAGEAGDAAR